MKRSVCLLAALLLALSACNAMAEVMFKTEYFTLTLPSGWEVDTDSEEVKKDETFLGIFGSPEEIGMVVEVFLEYFDDFKDVSLWNMNEAELKDYSDMLMEDFADESPENLGVTTVGNIPFVFIKATDEYGEYLYAETMTNGNAIEFEAYIADYDNEKTYPLKDEDIEQFKAILSTFQPVMGN